MLILSALRNTVIYSWLQFSVFFAMFISRIWCKTATMKPCRQHKILLSHVLTFTFCLSPYYCIRKCKRVTLPLSLILFLCLLVCNSGRQMWIFVGGDLSTQLSDVFLTECREQRQGYPDNWIQNYCLVFVSLFVHNGFSWDHECPLDEYCKALWLCKVLFQGEETGEGGTSNMIKEGDNEGMNGPLIWKMRLTLSRCL